MTLSSACSNTETGFCLVLPSMMSSAPYTIFSATDFLPCRMIEFMNFETTKFPNFGSGWISRFSALWRRDIGSVLDAFSDLAVLAVRLAGYFGLYLGRYFGRLAPYFERRCLRFFTPW